MMLILMQSKAMWNDYFALICIKQLFAIVNFDIHIWYRLFKE
jgi:hypothetical protein